MPPTPPSSRSYPPALALVLAPLLACHARATPPTYPTTDRWEPARRQPDAVALDPLPASTQASSQGSAPSPVPVALQPPLAVETAFEALRSLLDALTREDLSPLPSLLTERSTWVNLPNHTSVPLQAHLRERMRRLDYLQLAGQTLVREAEAEVYTHDDLTAMMVGRPARPGEMAPTDLLLRVRVLIPRIGADRLFGDTLLLVVRPDQGRYRIHSLQEDFQIP